MKLQLSNSLAIDLPIGFTCSLQQLQSGHRKKRRIGKSEAAQGHRSQPESAVDNEIVTGQRYVGATLRQISPARPDP